MVPQMQDKWSWLSIISNHCFKVDVFIDKNGFLFTIWMKHILLKEKIQTKIKQSKVINLLIICIEVLIITKIHCVCYYKTTTEK